ncbi:MAG: TonB-dependent receptor plug domain-containing protein, partial [Acidimicrobiia bacterium]
MSIISHQSSVVSPRSPVLAPGVALFAVICFTFLSSLADPARAATLQGSVVDPDGAAITDAKVVVSGPLGVVATAETDGSGRFRVTALSAGSYELRVIAPGLYADPISIDRLAEAETREISVKLRLSAFADSIVVSAAQIDQPLDHIPDSVTVITSKDLETRQVQTLADALRTVAGMTVTATGGRGALTSVFLRGGESDFTLVLVDGVEVNDFGGGFDFAHLPVADIERIEVVRGPQGSVHGANAIAGVIQVITKHGGTRRAQLLAEGGNLGTWRTAADTSGRQDRIGWGFALSRLRTDGYTGVAPATGERVTNDDYQTQDGSFSLGYQIARTELRTAFRLGRNERGLPGPYGSNPGSAFTEVDRTSRGTNDGRIWLAAYTGRLTSTYQQ